MRDGKPVREFEQLLRKRPVILEVGANDGSHTCEFLGAFPSATILAFEPEPRAIAKFKARRLPGVRLFEHAIGARTGETVFYRSGGKSPRFPQFGDWDASGSIREPAFHLERHPWCTFERRMTVPISTLDAAVAPYGFKVIDLVWADVQGAEEDLVRGATETLKRTHYLYSEYSDKEMYRGQIGLSALCDLIPDFEVVETFRNDVLLKNKIMSKKLSLLIPAWSHAALKALRYPRC